MPVFLFVLTSLLCFNSPICLRNMAIVYKLLRLQCLGEAVITLLHSCNWIPWNVCRTTSKHLFWISHIEEKTSTCIWDCMTLFYHKSYTENFGLQENIMFPRTRNKSWALVMLWILKVTLIWGVFLCTDPFFRYLELLQDHFLHHCPLYKTVPWVLNSLNKNLGKWERAWYQIKLSLSAKIAPWEKEQATVIPS